MKFLTLLYLILKVNIIFLNWQDKPYLGLGAGAHGYYGDKRVPKSL